MRRTPRVPPPIVDQLAAAEWETRAAARDHLTSLGADAIPVILKGCSHTDPQARAECIALLDHFADERCLEALKTALHDQSARVRRHAVHSLGCQQCKPRPLQLDVVALLVPLALADPSIRVRRVAVHQLGLQHPDPRITDALRRILRVDRDPGLLQRARHARDAHRFIGPSGC